MFTRYNGANIFFSVDGCAFSVLNLVCERFERVIPLHSHGPESFEIHYIASGRGSALIGGTSYQLAPGALYVTGPGVVHAQRPDPSDPMTEYCLSLKVSLQAPRRTEKEHGAGESFVKTPFWFAYGQDGIAPLILSIFSELESRRAGYLSFVQALLTQLIVTLARSYEQAPAPAARSFDLHLADDKYLIVEECFLYEYKTLTLEALAARLNLGPRQTQRLLKKIYGATFLQKRMQARMAAAAMLLSDAGTSVAQAAEAVGYSSAEHFSAAFRRFYGRPPGAYRNRAAKELSC